MTQPDTSSRDASRPETDDQRGWSNAGVRSALSLLSVETSYGGCSSVVPLGVVPMAQNPAPLPREAALEALLALRKLLSQGGASLEDVTTLTLAVADPAHASAVLNAARALFLSPRPAVQMLVSALPDGALVAIGATTAPRMRAAVRRDFDDATIL